MDASVPFELFIALRYLLARRQQSSISRVSLFSTIGVAVGVMALVVALALMTGLQGELRNRILGSQAHIYVWKTGSLGDYEAEVARLRELPGVAGAGPAIVGKAIASSARADAFITLKGCGPRARRPGDGHRADDDQGQPVRPRPNTGEDDRPGILLGHDLAQQLGAEVGDEITLITPGGSLSPMGLMPRNRRVMSSVSFNSGSTNTTRRTASSLSTSRDGCTRRKRPISFNCASTTSGLRQGSPDRSRTVSAPSTSRGLVRAQSFSFFALWLEKMAISITIGLIVMVGALNIISSLDPLVKQKSRDIAILKTMGTSSVRVMTIFMMQGLVIGVIGTTVGGLAGLALCWVLDTYELIQIPMDVYQVSHVPFIVQPIDFLVVVVSTIAICFLATIYPSRQASRLDPVQALRFE